MIPGETLPRRFFERDADVVAPELLGKLLVVEADGEVVAGRIVEVEAYRSDDPASHSHRGERPRNRSMFGPPGHLYVYLSYGIHHCVNVVCAAVGDGQAVLLRAVEPVAGLRTMRRRRGGVRDVDLANGPGKLGQAFGLDLSDDGADVVDETHVVDGGRRVVLADDGTPPPSDPIVAARVGISVGTDLMWRWRAP